MNVSMPCILVLVVYARCDTCVRAMARVRELRQALRETGDQAYLRYGRLKDLSIDRL